MKPTHSSGGYAKGRAVKPVHIITIPGWRPALINEIMRGKLKERMQHTKTDRKAIAECLLEQPTPKACHKRRVSLHVILGKHKKEFDVDAPWKSLFDSLKQNGMIVDDTCRYCEHGTLTFERGAITTSIITLEDL